jgi:hypothetical protein
VGNLVFPTLPGLMWGVSKTPQWTTKIQKAVSGKEFRSAWMSAPLYTFRLSYEVLREGSAFQELQQLAAFFNNVRGSFDSFLYSDPADNAVTAQQFGTGNGVATQFQLVRSYGGNTEAVGAPFMGSTNPELITNGTFAANINGWALSTVYTLGTVSWDATGALLLTKNATVGGFGAVSSFPTVPGKVYDFSYSKAGGTSTGTVGCHLGTVANNADLVSGLGMGSAAAGTYSVRFTAQSTTTWVLFFNNTVSTTALFDNVTCKLVDGPVVYSNGAIVQPSGYSISSSTGALTFTAAPAAGAVLSWAGSYYYRCRFLQDGMELSAFMSKLWEAKRVEFIGSLSPNRI